MTKDPHRLYLMSGSGLDVETHKPKSGKFTEYVRKDLINSKNNKNYRYKDDTNKDIRHWTLRKLRDRHMVLGFQLSQRRGSFKEACLFAAVVNELKNRGYIKGE